MLELVLIISVVNLCISGIVFWTLHNGLEHLEWVLRWKKDEVTGKSPEIPVKTPEEPEHFIDAKELTEYELQRIEEESEFDLRIARIKDELSQRLPESARKGTEAVVLHPSIQNLPHSIIPDYFNDLPDVEITQ